MIITQFMSEEIFSYLSNVLPVAAANITGAPNYSQINGTVLFYQTNMGVFVISSVQGLPGAGDKCDNPIFAMHIHDGENCTGNKEDPFANSGKHYNPNDCMHPQHAGDLPPLFSNKGFAWNAVLTQRFNVKEILNKTVIIHRNPDDFTTQPSGNSGEKIACGVILKQYDFDK